MPAPGAFDDAGQIWKRWFPAQFFTNFVASGNQLGWISRPAGSHLDWNWVSGDFPRGFYDLFHRKAVAITQIVSATAGIERLQGCRAIRAGERQRARPALGETGSSGER